MKWKIASLALATAQIGTFVVAPVSTQAAPKTAAATFPVNTTGTTSGAPLTFVGTVTLNQVVSQGGNLFGVGTLTGTLSNAAGVIGQVTNAPFQAPLTAAATQPCQILDLTLGPLDLNLLGLLVHLDTVHLNITAQPGSGNLLGNLLCSVAHLLDSNASGNALANLLNRILGLLG
jgi:hypothetical protein